MTTRCLICNSSAVLSKEAGQAIAGLIGSLDSFLKGYQQSASGKALVPDAQDRGPLEKAFNRMLDGVAAAHSNWSTTQAFIKDIRRHQFMEYDCLCLRCGAKYDENPEKNRPAQ